MIPQSMQQRQQQSYSQNVQQQQQQYNQVYKVQSNQYSGSGERITGQQQPVEEDDRPGSRLKQNIDELDTLLYDLNNARNLSPETAEYGTAGPSSHGGGLLDSDDYDETVGTTGHVKRTVSAFNEYTTQQQGGKPPSPAPRRKPS